MKDLQRHPHTFEPMTGSRFFFFCLMLKFQYLTEAVRGALAGRLAKDFAFSSQTHTLVMLASTLSTLIAGCLMVGIELTSSARQQRRAASRNQLNDAPRAAHPARRRRLGSAMGSNKASSAFSTDIYATGREPLGPSSHEARSAPESAVEGRTPPSTTFQEAAWKPPGAHKGGRGTFAGDGTRRETGHLSRALACATSPVQTQTPLPFSNSRSPVPQHPRPCTTVQHAEARKMREEMNGRESLKSSLDERTSRARKMSHVPDTSLKSSSARRRVHRASIEAAELQLAAHIKAKTSDWQKDRPGRKTTRHGTFRANRQVPEAAPCGIAEERQTETPPIPLPMPRQSAPDEMALHVRRSTVHV